MVRRWFLFAAAMAVPMGILAGEAGGPPALAKGDRIVFLGDSITAGGGGAHGYITLVKNTLAQECKDLGIEVFNAGISGHKVPNLQARLDKDVIAKKPTIVFIYIGINDVWHWRKNAKGEMAGGTTKEKFEEGLKDLIARIKAAGARVVLCTPSTIGEKPDGTNERDAMLEEYSDISRKVAADTGVQLNDLRKAFIAYEKENNKEGKARGVLTGDGVHLNPAGNKFVAGLMLQALGIKAEPVETKQAPPKK
ncbi:MAG TPA: SGNH/GDSL hydrolase family protein [Planctomycetota bacterium]|nr:SGNH/GDSL hydrolase family protein [Planctomycetota bacterium]